MASEMTSCAYPALPPPISLPLITTAPHPCPYLPDRQATLRAFAVRQMDAKIYHRFMNASFRRSGRVIYQPVCCGCRECKPLRIMVERFVPSKSQRRCWRKNQDLTVEVGEPKATDEKWELYERFRKTRFGDASGQRRDAFEDFLYDSPVKTIECVYRDASGKLLAVGICDVCHESLSSVYFYFEPTQKQRGLGTFGVLWELDYARQKGIAEYYLGFWVNDCKAMRYKASFRPHEVLLADGKWREISKNKH